MDVLMDIMLSDKKRSGSTITCVIPTKVGQCIREKMDLDRLRSFMEAGM